MKMFLVISVLVVMVVVVIVGFGLASDDASSSGAAPGVAETSGSPVLSATSAPVPAAHDERANIE